MKKRLTMVSLLAILLPAVFGVPSCRTEKKPDLRLSAYTWEIDVDDSNRLYEGSTVISNEGKGVLKIDYVNSVPLGEDNSTNSPLSLGIQFKLPLLPLIRYMLNHSPLAT